MAPFVLGHRRRRLPFDQPGISEPELDDAFDRAAHQRQEHQDERDGERDGDAPWTREEVIAPEPASSSSIRLTPPRAPVASSGKGSLATSPRGRFVRDEAFSDSKPVAAVATAIATATRRATMGRPTHDLTLQRRDLRSAVADHKAGNLIVFVVDTSGSMGADRRIGAAKGAVLGLLADAYKRRDRVALIAFRGSEAEVVLRPTGSVEIARARLAELPTGGTTPLASALRLALDVTRGSTGDQQLVPLLVIITDGRATQGGDDPLAETGHAAEAIRRAAITSIVVDAEHGTPRLGLAGELAAHLGADCVPLDALRPGQPDGRLEQTVRARLASTR